MRPRVHLCFKSDPSASALAGHGPQCVPLATRGCALHEWAQVLGFHLRVEFRFCNWEAERGWEERLLLQACTAAAAEGTEVSVPRGCQRKQQAALRASAGLPCLTPELPGHARGHSSVGKPVASAP